MKLSAKALVIKIGETKKEVTQSEQIQTQKSKTKVNFSFRINRAKFRDACRRQGRYLLRINVPRQVPATLWELLHPTHSSGGSLQEG